MSFFRACKLISPIFLSGCAVLPLPEDVSGVDTYDIAQTIRCETRDAIRHVVAETISHDHPDLYKRLLSNPSVFVGLDTRNLTPRTQKILDRYDQAAITYDFTFDITETNKADVGLAVTKVFNRGPLKTSLAAGKSLERRTRDTFRLSSTFRFLSVVMPESYCDTARKGTNFSYPITGTIGMSKLVQGFISLNQSGSLVGTADDPTIPVKVTTLDFTTEINGSVNPVLELAAVGTRVTGASLLASASRKDLHTVIITMALPPDTGSAGQSITEIRALEAGESIRRRQAYDDRTNALVYDE